MPLLSPFEKRVMDGLVLAIHRQPEFAGCKVNYKKGSLVVVLHGGVIPARNANVCVVIEPNPGEPRTSGISNASRVSAELNGLGLNCLMLGVSLLGMTAGAAATVGSAGLATPASGALTVLGWTGVVTGAIQTTNAAGRVAELYWHPDSNSLQQMDLVDWYSNAILAVDYVGVASSVASLPMAYRSVLNMLEQHGKLMSIASLLALSPSRRKDAIRQALNQAASTPQGKAALQKAAAAEKLSPKILTLGTKSKSDGGKAIRAIKAASLAQIQHDFLSITKQQIPMAHSFLINMQDSSSVGTASGSLNTLGNYFMHVIMPE